MNPSWEALESSWNGNWDTGGARGTSGASAERWGARFLALSTRRELEFTGKESLEALQEPRCEICPRASRSRATLPRGAAPVTGIPAPKLPVGLSRRQLLLTASTVDLERIRCRWHFSFRWHNRCNLIKYTDRSLSCQNKLDDINTRNNYAASHPIRPASWNQTRQVTRRLAHLDPGTRTAGGSPPSLAMRFLRKFH